jgi:hypothetical protein
VEEMKGGRAVRDSRLALANPWPFGPLGGILKRDGDAVAPVTVIATGDLDAPLLPAWE